MFVFTGFLIVEDDEEEVGRQGEDSDEDYENEFELVVPFVDDVEGLVASEIVKVEKMRQTKLGLVEIKHDLSGFCIVSIIISVNQKV